MPAKMPAFSTKIQLVALADITPYDRNPRNNDSAVSLVRASIEQFGFKVPIILDTAHVIVCGHTRYKAAQELGLDSVPCIIADDLTPAQIKAYRLADNKVGEAAEWDLDKLAEELAECVPDFDMADFGFAKDPEIAFEEFCGSGDGGGSQVQNGDKVRIVVGAAMFDIADPTHELYAKTKDIDTESLGASITEIINSMAK